jgi:hypothetical protein
MSFTTEMSRDELMGRLQNFVALKKYSQRRSRWAGLGTLADRPGLVHCWVLAEGDWERDDDMEARVAAWKALQTDRSGPVNLRGDMD